MTKQMPKTMINKIERMNKLMEQVVSLNIELEEWLEKNGISDGFDLATDYRESRGYEIFDVDGFVARVNEELGA